jgi:hypothetical protein
MTSTRCLPLGSERASTSGVALMLGARVKPEYGPSLPELLESRAVRVGLRLRGLFVLVTIAVVVIVGLSLATGGASLISRSVPGMSFSFSYASMQREAAPPGQYALVEKRRGSELVARLAVAPLPLPAYAGDVSGLAPVVMGNYVRALAAQTPGFVLQTEGPTSVNGIAGYNFTYTEGIDGTTYYGRVIMVTQHQSGERRALMISLLAQPVLAGTIGPGRSALAGALYEPGQGGVGVLFQPAGLLALPLATLRLGS